MAPKILDLGFFPEESSDHVAKFCGDRPTELGDLMAKKKEKTSAVKHTTARNYRSRLPN